MSGLYRSRAMALTTLDALSRLKDRNHPQRLAKKLLTNIKTIASCVAFTAGFSLVASNSFAAAVQLEVTITNNSPTGGVAITPVWVGFHNGSFDSYDAGSPAAGSLELLAELGQTVPISDVFAGTLVGDAIDSRVQGAIANGGPITAGGSASQQFSVDDGGTNAYFSYASMVLPSNDFFVANGNPLAHSLESLFNGSLTSISFDIGTVGTVNDAGTEVNDFAFSAGNPIAGISAGDAPGGAAEGGVITSVVAADPFAGFLTQPGIDISALNFNDIGQYANGIATITISVVPAPVPLPAALPLAFTAIGGLFAFARRRKPA